MNAEKSSTEHLGLGTAGVHAGRDRDERGRYPQIWTVEKALQESKRFETRKEFRIKEPSAYAYLVKKKASYLLSFNYELKRHSLSDWDVLCALKSSKSRSEFRSKRPREYSAYCKRDHLKRLGADSHLPKSKTSKKWNHQNVKILAKRYKSISVFAKENSGAYSYAYENGIVKDISMHMDRPKSNFNVCYMWIADVIDERFIVKVGVTSKRLGMRRIKYVSLKSGYTPLESWSKETNNALKIESKLKGLGVSAKLGGFSGSSEFFIYTKNELETAKEILYAATK